MAGLMVFPDLQTALAQGYQVCDRTPEGYLVRISTAAGWAFAIVDCRVKRA